MIADPPAGALEATGYLARRRHCGGGRPPGTASGPSSPNRFLTRPTRRALIRGASAIAAPVPTRSKGTEAGRRVLVGVDGRRRATWQWKAAREAAAAPAAHQDLCDSARGVPGLDGPWFHAANERRFRADLFDTGATCPVRVVSFALEDQPPPSRLVERDDLTLRQLIADIDARLDVAVAEDMAGVMGLRIHSPREIVIIKPAARRYWLGIDGLDDAGAVLAMSFGAGAG